MLNQSIEYSQNRKKPAKKAMNIHDRAIRREQPCDPVRRLADGRAR